MTGYQIGKVRYQNFGPFEDVTFDFSRPGLTLVEGFIEGRRGCDSNGAGKSYLFDGVSWVLYDRCIREKYKGDDVIRLGSKGGTCVTVELLGGSDTVSLERYRKHPKYKNQVRLIVGGKDVTRGTNDLTTEAIEAIIGMDFMAFCNSVAFGVREDVKSFFSAPESERKKVMDRIFGLLVYGDAEQEARKRLKTAEEELNALALKRTSLQSKLEERREQLAEAQTSEDAEEAALHVKETTIKVKGLEKKIVKAEEKRDAAIIGRDKEKEKYDAALLQYREAEKRYLHEKARLEQADRKLQREIAELKGGMNAAVRTQLDFRKLKGKQCPTCFQKVADKAVKQVEMGTQAEIDKAREAIAELQRKSAAVDKLLEALDKPKEPESPELEARQEALDQREEELQELTGQRDVAQSRLTALKEEQERHKGLLESLQAKVDEMVKVLAAKEQEYQTQVFMQDQIAFWVQGFGNAGLKSFLLEAEIPEINRRASAYARMLLGDGTLVKLAATKTLKTKGAVREQLSIEAVIPGCTKTYAGASKGQKKRLDLSLLLAFRDIVSERNAKPFKQLFADEIFDGLDKSGNESVAALLLEVSERCPVTLVTHISGLKSIAHHAVIVYHDGQRATLLAEKPTPKRIVAAPKRKPKLKPKPKPSLKQRLKRK